MSTLQYFMLGVVLGFLGVGLPTLRTIRTMEGYMVSVFFISLCASASMYLFMNLVVSLKDYSIDKSKDATVDAIRNATMDFTKGLEYE